MVVRCNRKQSASVGDVLFFCGSFHYALGVMRLASVIQACRWVCKVFPHDIAVHLLTSSIMLPDTQSHEVPAS